MLGSNLTLPSPHANVNTMLGNLAVWLRAHDPPVLGTFLTKVSRLSNHQRLQNLLFLPPRSGVAAQGSEPNQWDAASRPKSAASRASCML